MQESVYKYYHIYVNKEIPKRMPCKGDCNTEYVDIIQHARD